MSDIRFIAKTYIDQGWSVVPLVNGEKRASGSWRKKTYSPSDFGPSDGIAVKCGDPSQGLTDVDLDSTEAIEAAKHLLPSTGLVHGRPGKPESHYWFKSLGAKTHQFTDIKDPSGKTSMLVEIRSTGGYTAIPPSGHPSGDLLGWVVERDPLDIEPDVLFECVREVALAAGATLAGVRPLVTPSLDRLPGSSLQAKLSPASALRIIKDGRHHRQRF